MRIFVTSDTHNDYIILKKLKDFLTQNTFDYTIHCGDIGGSHSSGQTFIEFGKQQYDNFIYFKEHFPSMLFILGNDDWFEAEDGKYIKASNREIPKNFIGFEWVNITPFNTNREANENKIAYELSKLGKDFSKSIVVAHDPPHNCLDMIHRGEAVGSKSIRKFIEQYQPKLWLCGYIHEAFGVSSIGTTGVFNCSSRPDKHQLQGWIIDVETLDYETVII